MGLVEEIVIAMAIAVGNGFRAESVCLNSSAMR